MQRSGRDECGDVERLQQAAWGFARVRRNKGRAARGSDATLEVCGLCRHLLHGYTELYCLIDEVLGDAAAGEGDDALGEKVKEFVVAPERSSPSVAVPVPLADDLVDAALVGPTRGDALDAGAAAVDQHHVGVRLRIRHAGELPLFPT